MELLQGDCLELMKTIPDKSIDMVLCDLPYGTTHAPWDKPVPLEPLWAEYSRIIKDNGAIALFSQLPFAADLINAKREWFRYEIVWEKTSAAGFLNAHKMPLRAHENILLFYGHLPTYNPQYTYGKDYTALHKPNRTNLYGGCKGAVTVNDGRRFPRDVVKFSKRGGSA